MSNYIAGVSTVMNGRGAWQKRHKCRVLGYRGFVDLVNPDGSRVQVWEGPLRQTDREALDDAVAQAYDLEREAQEAILNQIDEIARSFGLEPIGDCVIPREWSEADVVALSHPTEWAGWLDDNQDPDGITIDF